ncbi:DUF4345 family protein [Rhodovibrio salinarum]|uniref:DUF4345 domain-containing protein n=1 Tax=Rhodovibrio salinarum TaxID=1087 RepID=A0A934V051_9PROT|nr:DUF4345 family protein [Rhodovibrio salinarum]MBK1697872.1 DUF4345 domain-containing protein [Rhodovibrio salinarum]
MLAARLICALSALVCLLVGLWSLLDPAGVAGMIGYVFAGPAGQVEFVTVYGGFYTGVGAFLALATLREDWLIAALAMSTLGAGGAFVARLAGTLAIGTAPGLTLDLLISEAVWAGLSAVGWYLASRRG